MNPGWHFRALTIWIAVMAALYFLFQDFLAPKVVDVSSMASGEVVIPRSTDGHYYLVGHINGQAVDFMVDTGATLVSVSTDLARAANLPSGYPTTFSTANGSHQGERVSGQTVEAAGLTVTNIEVGVGLDLGKPNQGLLGQSFLNHVDMIQSGDRLILRRRNG